MNDLVSSTLRGDLPEHLVDVLFSRIRRVLFFGEPGTGKSTLVAMLGRKLSALGRTAYCIDADPGSPAFGIPGTVCCGALRAGEFERFQMEALCTLDAARFRLPLISAVRRLAQRDGKDSWLLDAPGVTRGVAGSELLLGLVEAAAIDTVIVVTRSHHKVPLRAELRASGAEVFLVRAASAARRLSPAERVLYRTSRWNAYLEAAVDYSIGTPRLEIVGTPPPLSAGHAWAGRQVALLQGSRTTALGEVAGVEGGTLRLKIPENPERGGVLLVRDARRDRRGHLRTAKQFPPQASPESFVFPTPLVASLIPQGFPAVRMAGATASLVNGIFGDPLLVLRFLHQKRCLVFDLGESTRLPARLVHQVTDIFISHAHMDHIIGFLPLLRLRIGEFPSCRIFGPPGISGHIEGLLRGIEWDRIGSNGPRFQIAELHDRRLLRFEIRAGESGLRPLGEGRVHAGVLLQEPAFLVRATMLDHGTPVLAFAFEQAKQIKVRKERLSAQGLHPGPWLGELKQRLARGERNALLRLPDGRRERAGTLAEELILIAPGQRLVYATDLADTAENRRRLVVLAQGAHTFFCEASFLEADQEQAVRTGHLTAKACGEIAAAAGVQHLVPFHFSKRYEASLEPIYKEVRAGFPLKMRTAIHAADPIRP